MSDVFFVTNRRPNRKRGADDFGKDFNADGPNSIRYGWAEVSGDTLDRYEITVLGERILIDPELRREAGSRHGSERMMSELRRKMVKHQRDTVVFIHGYNVSFKEALTAATEMKFNFLPYDQGKGINMVLFSWPSDGRKTPFIAYSSDRRDAEASGPAVARAFLKLCAFQHDHPPEQACGQKLHLIAHSMGNYVLRHALQEIRRWQPGRPPRLFDQVLLMAADEDDDAFEHEHKLKLLPRIARRVNVYFNNGDIAMGVSDLTKGNPDRLGADGPRHPRQVPGKVTLVDCTPVVEGLVEHTYYKDEPVVVQDMLTTMAGVEADAFGPTRRYIPETNRYRLVRPA